MGKSKHLHQARQLSSVVGAAWSVSEDRHVASQSRLRTRAVMSQEKSFLPGSRRTGWWHMCGLLALGLDPSCH